MASVMGICGGLVGPKSGNVEKPLVVVCFFEVSRATWGRQRGEQRSEPDRLGGGRGRVNPPPRRLVWRFWEVWRVGCWFGASTRLEARGLGGLNTNVMRVASQRCQQTAEKYRLGGGRGRVNLPLVGLFEVLEVWMLVHSIYTPRGQRPRRICLFHHRPRNCR